MTKTGIVKQKPQIKYIHKCSQKTVLNRLNLIIIGNGKPEEGLAFRFREFMDDHKEVVDSINEIKSKVNDVINSSGRAVRAIESYKLEVSSFEKGKVDTEEKQKIADDLKRQKDKEHWQRWIWVIMAFFAFCALGINLYFNLIGNEKADVIINKQDSMGVTVVTRKGEIMSLPSDAEIKFFPKGFLGDTTKKDTIK